MIIQCRKCRTKFTFNENLMLEDGVWLRCSSCMHVFFQDSSHSVKNQQETCVNEAFDFMHDAPSARVEDEAYYEKMLDSGKDSDVTQFLDNFTDKNNNRIEENGETALQDNEITLQDEDITLQDDEIDQTIPEKKKGLWKAWKVALWSVFVILIIPAIIYFFIFPQYGERLVKIANMYFGTPEPEEADNVAGKVKLQDIRQRILNNYVLGQIRIVEGTAVNQADYPICRIIIKSEIVDAYSVVLSERTGFAGNVLTEEELTTLSEEEIQRILAQSSGRNNANDKILPNTQIPFMLVFAHEPPGMIKTTLMTIGAERLL